MAKKINYYGHVRLDGSLIEEALTEICYLRGTSQDNLRLTQQTVKVDASITDQALPILLREGAAFTYFFVDDLNINSGVSIKINGDSTVFSISPDFWVEDDIDSILISNSSSQEYTMSVVQLFSEKFVVG